MKLDQFYSQINYMIISFDEIKINYSTYLINCYMYKSYIRMNILWYLHVIETFVKAKYCCDKCLLMCFAPRIMFFHNLVQKLVYCTCLGQPRTIRACMPIGQIQHRICLFLLFFLQGTSAIYCIQSCFLVVNTHLYLMLMASQPMFFQYEAFDIPTWS
jgi:hypothetical protein